MFAHDLVEDTDLFRIAPTKSWSLNFDLEALAEVDPIALAQYLWEVWHHIYGTIVPFGTLPY